MYTVYRHINITNGKSYIGLTKQNPEDRFGSNGQNYKDKCPRFWSAISHYGWDNFYHMIVQDDIPTKEMACYIEKELIKMYNTQDKDKGYNILSGGQCPEITLETRDKMSKAMIGNKNGLGKVCSEEKKRKISEAQKGMVFSEERKKKMSIAASKRHVPCSESKRETLRQAYPHKKAVYCEETDTVYSSVQECARELNLNASLVSKVCLNKLKTTGGYHLKHNDDIINA